MLTSTQKSAIDEIAKQITTSHSHSGGDIPISELMTSAIVGHSLRDDEIRYLDIMLIKAVPHYMGRNGL